MLGSTADTCTASVYGAFEEAHILSKCRWTLGDDFRIGSVLALSLVQQRIHALRHSTELFEEAHIFPRDGRLGLLYSALCLVQQRIHALRQSTAAWDFHGVSP